MKVGGKKDISLVSSMITLFTDIESMTELPLLKHEHKCITNCLEKSIEQFTTLTDS